MKKPRKEDLIHELHVNLGMQDFYFLQKHGEAYRNGVVNFKKLIKSYNILIQNYELTQEDIMKLLIFESSVKLGQWHFNMLKKMPIINNTLEKIPIIIPASEK